ncbi:MAG: Spy/CpxP family protein refolding chaperone [Candidatus Omnitrophica bacterium]|nr:Spy/CpxP family protein refolding chaperone [Candidatus Omnitrophota bacterium]
MTKLKRVLLSGFFLSVLSTACLVQADNPSQADSLKTAKHGGVGIQEIFSQLNLTEPQKKQLEDNKTKHRNKMKIARQQREAYSKDLQQELMKPQLDMNKINDIHNQLKAQESKIADERLDSILTVRAILTSQQFSEFLSLMNKHKLEHAKAEGHEEHE